ncbi:AraC family transcriptional regulator [Paenibacillus selenitireducens]|uniref:AraC family transcriptional regulator n=1 Tax=Paenibacillus selenitireducens TaxID=1324314 RepID=A0A1T2X4H1_9BACL|nr:AraC family transcriptional regulator [Paenibacillus selenitireducens]OPA74586.1 AraC family transcriptional regulator [Paenibacillus selenitireducens]
MFPYYLQGDDEMYGEYPFTLKIHHLETNIPAHVHHFVEYTYAIKGRGTEIINGVSKELIPGTFTLVFPHQVHEIKIEPGEELVLYVGAIGLKAFFGGDKLFDFHQLLKGAEFDLNTTYKLDAGTASIVHSLLEQMYEEIREVQPWSRMMFVSKLVQVFVLFDRFRQGHLLSDHASGHEGGTAKGIRELISYVYQNFKEDITLETLAKQFNYSVSYISSAFKQMVGENYYTVLERIRIAHACNLLVGTDLKITDIAYEAGFKSYPTFVRVFQSRMQMSPTSYRKNKGIEMV